MSDVRIGVANFAIEPEFCEFCLSDDDAQIVATRRVEVTLWIGPLGQTSNHFSCDNHAASFAAKMRSLSVTAAPPAKPSADE